MRVMYNSYDGKRSVVGEVLTNRSMTLQEAMYALGYDVNSQEDLETARNNGCEWAYLDDCGYYQWDFENMEMEY